MSFWALVFFGLILSASYGTPGPPAIGQDPRIAEIETYYHMKFDAVLLIQGAVFWMFKVGSPDLRFKAFPVVVPAGSDNREIDVATIAAANCALWYDSNLKGKK